MWMTWFANPTHSNKKSTHLQKIFEKFEKENITINLEKSQLCRQKVPFFGYKLTTTVIKWNDDKIKVISDFASPKTIKTVKRIFRPYQLL